VLSSLVDELVKNCNKLRAIRNAETGLKEFLMEMNSANKPETGSEETTELTPSQKQNRKVAAGLNITFVSEHPQESQCQCQHQCPNGTDGAEGVDGVNWEYTLCDEIVGGVGIFTSPDTRLTEEHIPSCDLWHKLVQKGYPAFKECEDLFHAQVCNGEDTVANVERLITLLRSAPLFMRLRLLRTAIFVDQQTHNAIKGEQMHPLYGEVMAIRNAIKAAFGVPPVSRCPYVDCIIGRDHPECIPASAMLSFDTLWQGLLRHGYPAKNRELVRTAWGNGSVSLTDFDKYLGAIIRETAPNMFGLGTLPMDADPFDYCFGKLNTDEINEAAKERVAEEERAEEALRAAENEPFSTKNVVASMEAYKKECADAAKEVQDAFKKASEKPADDKPTDDKPANERPADNNRAMGFMCGLGMSPEGAEIWKRCKEKKQAEKSHFPFYTVCDAKAAAEMGFPHLSKATGIAFTLKDSGRPFSLFRTIDVALDIIRKVRDFNDADEAVFRELWVKGEVTVDVMDGILTLAVVAAQRDAEVANIKYSRLNEATGWQLTGADGGRLFSEFMDEGGAWKIVSKHVLFTSPEEAAEAREMFAELWKYGRITVSRMERLLTYPLVAELRGVTPSKIDLALSEVINKTDEEILQELEADDEDMTEADKVLCETIQKVLDVLDKQPVIPSEDLSSMFATLAHVFDRKPSMSDCCAVLEMYTLRKTLKAVAKMLRLIVGSPNNFVKASDELGKIIEQLRDNGFNGLTEDDIAAGNFNSDAALDWLEEQKKQWL
jgi:hypothetical protein